MCGRFRYVFSKKLGAGVGVGIDILLSLLVTKKRKSTLEAVEVEKLIAQENAK